MNSQFVNAETQELAGFSFKSFAKDTGGGAAAGSAVPGPGTAIGAGAGAVKNIIGSIVGGGKEAGYGRAKPQTLPWYIDKLKGVNDNEAIDEIAPAIVRMKLKGASDLQIRAYLKEHSDEGKLGPEEYNPILRSLDETIAQAKQAQQNSDKNQTNSNNMAASAAGFNKGWILPALLGLGGISVLTAVISNS